MFSFNSRLYVVLFLTLSVSGQATAMTVYDVIQLSKNNYTDKGIIALIETTDSAFELKADDVARLVELGVSEPVVQAMLRAVPAEPPGESASAENKHDNKHDSKHDNKHDHRTAVASITSNKFVPRASIDSEPLTEPGSGGHRHQVITLSGIRLFVLRNEAGYPSVTARAKVVVKSLIAASAIDGGGKFQPAHIAGNNVVVYTATENEQSVVVVSVSAQDASAYQRRSGRQVTPDLLAAYWSDLLTDYWSLALNDQPPERLAKLHEGEALQEFYDGLDKSIINDADRLTRVFKALPKQERDHLLQLAVTVPHDFNATDEHAGETP